MNRVLKNLFIFMWIVAFLVTGCKGNEIPFAPPSLQSKTLIVEDTNGVDVRKVNNYHIDVQFYPEEARLETKQIVDYINNEDVPLEEIYFHLYPNAFQKEDTVPFLFDDFQRAYPNGFQPGFIEIKAVAVDGKGADYQILGEQATILKVKLDQPLLVGKRAKIAMDYMVKLPPAQERFGYGNDTFNFGNWYPIAAVYDGTGWNLDPYYAIGDPFYSDVSNYEVIIHTPKEITVAASGNILKDEIQDDKRIWKIEATLMRDFAWVAGKKFEVVEKNVEGTILKMYFIKDENVKEEIKAFATMVGEDALRVFNKIYGKYPYGQYSVVQTNFPSGMEYPGIVFIGKEFYNDYSREYLEIVIVHETAHQWWYGVVGNDEIDEAWLDESLTSYSEVVYAMEMFGEEEGQNYQKAYNEGEYHDAIDSIQDKTILKSLDQFEGWDDYGPLVYNRGAMFLNHLYDRYGKEKLYQALKEYYQRYRFKIATTADFQKVCQEIFGEDMEPVFRQWLYGQ
ncbi:M1 family metallopeptidase [Thermotalea metallivorans]|uniref:Aminopeptidase N n=1 Tax=Thermotalea metallivorans TaxID=520762 RepID=A0A140L3V3_9FIRM|nr:M1 family metallopeptidase [Thermotalea metallivorans]KXG75228.1 Aminopeptidase N [Thermotalea metallivorans]